MANDLPDVAGALCRDDSLIPSLLRQSILEGWSALWYGAVVILLFTLLCDVIHLEIDLFDFVTSMFCVDVQIQKAVPWGAAAASTSHVSVVAGLVELRTFATNFHVLLEPQIEIAILLDVHLQQTRSAYQVLLVLGPGLASPCGSDAAGFSLPAFSTTAKLATYQVTSLNITVEIAKFSRSETLLARQAFCSLGCATCGRASRNLWVVLADLLAKLWMLLTVI